MSATLTLRRIIMKKTMTLILIIGIVLSFCSCGSDKNGIQNSNMPSNNEDYANAKKAYDLLEQAENICITGMDDIYNAWRFGIYDAPDCSLSTVFSEYANETSFSSTELSTDGGYEAIYLICGSGSTKGWQFCMWTIQNCLEKRGDFNEVDRLLAESKSYIQKITSEYEYYGDFKDYYAKVASYAEFFKAPSGSFEQLKTTILDYENGIRTAKEIFKFDFE